jgi:transcriptional regulator with XRE-family HTH domain
MQLGKTIKLLRTNVGIKQKDLAKKLLISSNYLSLVENGKREPSISLIERMAKELDVPISYIFWHAYEKPKNLPKDQERFLDLMKELLSCLQELSV